MSGLPSPIRMISAVEKSKIYENGLKMVKRCLRKHKKNFITTIPLLSQITHHHKGSSAHRFSGIANSICLGVFVRDSLSGAIPSLGREVPATVGSDSSTSWLVETRVPPPTGLGVRPVSFGAVRPRRPAYPLIAELHR